MSKKVIKLNKKTILNLLRTAFKKLKNPINFFTFIYICFVLSLLTISGNFWVWNIFSLVPAILLIPITIIFQLIWIRRFLRNKNTNILINLLLFFILLTSFRLSEFNIHALFKKESPDLENSISLFNWNTEYWHNKKDAQTFYSFLKNQNADIYHLQERILVHERFGINNPDDIETLASEFSEYQLITSDEMITMTRLPVVNIVKSEHKFLRVDMLVKDKVVSFYNVHIPVHLDVSSLENPLNFISTMRSKYYWREDEYDLLLNDIKNNSNPIVISGDFNTTKSMNRMNKFKGYTDSQKISGNLFPATWNIFGLKLWRIDYVLGNKNIKFLTHEDVSPEKLSDHWGQKIQLKLRNNE